MSGEQPLVSIVVPTYNYAVFLAEAVESALHQSHKNIEVIIVDDGSTDNTAVVAQALVQQDARVRYIYQPNQGLSAARNTGIKNAQGDFLVFLDADDVMHAHKIATHWVHFKREPLTDISYGSSRYFLSGQPEKTFASIALDEQDWMPKVSGSTAEIMPTLIANNMMPVCSAMLRRRVVDAVGGFDTSLKSLEDWDYWLRVATQKFYFSYSDDQQLAAYIRVHGISMSQNTLRMLQVQYGLRRIQIPRCLNRIADRVLTRQLQRDNEKRRLRCLATIATALGVRSAECKQLYRGESPVMLLKLFYRLLRKNR
ncbi:MAG: glycosyltransferase family 2 protein [Cellvibrionales bacterium]|nr:glycosyltransferase family 2 protein [Cellvibrionales bacterium]